MGLSYSTMRSYSSRHSEMINPGSVLRHENREYTVKGKTLKDLVPSLLFLSPFPPSLLPLHTQTGILKGFCFPEPQGKLRPKGPVSSMGLHVWLGYGSNSHADEGKVVAVITVL